ncbi:SDR family oxidoreductase [Williamsia serinedens]|uniref:Citronellol/citronellal dehydrogenase n=1 Tax=Williamsia serinedens TaxID=391736 RepID=A0ABT1H7A3_9NOCA|nr:NAD(P)-dependent oxidoreductase [Williamsia serinedens]MCP2162789.1 citronellol/citronellal dehydrogenase [Williamsia serinedens]
MATEPGTLRGRTLIISGGSRGIGEAIAVRAARDGANVALVAKTSDPHPKLPGTIHTAATAIEEAGGHALPIVGDIRDDDLVARAVAQTVEQFGGLDIVVNNASALDLTPSAELGMKRFDLMQSINGRGTFSLSTTAIPHLRVSDNAHILSLAPPIRLEPEFFDRTPAAYTLSKFAMTIVTLGLARELRGDGIAANNLWPRTTISTAAVRNILGADLIARSRTAEIMADAAYVILTSPAAETTGNCFIDDEVLTAAGVDDLGAYRDTDRDSDLELDFWTEHLEDAR